MPTAVVLEVCGQVFPIPPETIENGPSSRLTRLFKAGWSHEKSERITINRPAECFAAILAFYQTGELHIPMTSCPGAFLNEIEYWEISPEVLSGCCYYRLQSFLDEQETVRTFKSKQKQTVHKFSKTKSQNCFQKCRANIWEIIDYTKPSILGKLYLLLSIAMVLTSIFTLAYSTDPIFRRTMTNCERLEYMVTTGVEGFEIIRPYLQELCGESDVPKFTSELAEKLNRTDIFHLVRDTDGMQEDEDFLTFEFITTRVDQSGPDSRPGPETAKTFDTELISKHFNKSNIDLKVNNTEIITFLGDIANMAIDNDTDILSDNSNLTSSTGDTMFPILSLATSPMIHLDIARVTVPNLQTKILTLTILEMITTLFFSVELLLRLSTCPNLKFYFLSIINISDALSLLGTYLYFALYSIYPHLRFGSWIDYLDYCQMLRSLNPIPFV
ncbi:uncharacterized protein LOC132730101 [Ruditapes philippinarum]|uniref:uncharacterized protein LOC132730101 n=1 Tax=Ruditapes philippinarum TaxID=129788 RepID=UPI00295C2ED2|nr:uncharacterized protein LOC132730101 [Ruditapes philippinarum]